MSFSERALGAIFFAGSFGLNACAAAQSCTLAGQGPAAGAHVVISGASPKRGVANVVLPSGEQCSGRFNSVPDRLTWDDDRVHWVENEDSLVGMFVVSCPSGYFLRCDFAEDATEPTHGACRDRGGARYTLLP